MLAGTCASIVIFWLIFRFIRDHLGALPTAVSPPWAGAAVIASALQVSVVAYRWAYLTAELGAPLDYGTALGAYFVSVFLNQLLPLGMLGDALRAIWHSRRIAEARGADGAAIDAATALLLDRASGQLVLLLAVLAILPLWWRPLVAALGTLTPARTPLLVLAVFSACLLAVAVSFRRVLLRCATRARAAFLRPRALAMHSLCSLVALALHVLAFVCTAYALGFSLPLLRALRIVPLVLEASALPSFVLGAGAREAAAAMLYRLLGLAPAEGAAVALGVGVLGFVASLPGLALLLAARRRARAMPASG